MKNRVLLGLGYSLLWFSVTGTAASDKDAVATFSIVARDSAAGELGRLLALAQMNYAWNEAWTLFKRDRAKKALPHMERAVSLAPDNAEALYDLAVIRLAAGQAAEALEVLVTALQRNPKLKVQASIDSDLELLHGVARFEEITAGAGE